MRKYTSYFYSAPAGLGYEIEIHNIPETGTDVEMTMGVPPIVIDWPEVECYDPLMTSGATLKFITAGVYQGLMINSWRQAKVFIRSHWKENNEDQSQLVWAGWLTPNIYSQPYDHDREELELTAIDSISCLQYISYNQFIIEDGHAAEVRNMFELIRWILLRYCTDPYITEMWLPSSIKLGQGSGENVLKDLYVNEQLFIDEDMSCKEAIEAMLRYANLTAFVQYGIFEVIDRDHPTGVTLKKYNVGSGNLISTQTNVSYLLNDFDDYFQNTVSTKKLYKDISYTAKFGEFPTWTEYKDDTIYAEDANHTPIVDIIKLSATSGTTEHNVHTKETTWPQSLGEGVFATRVQLASCPDNIKLFAWNTTGGTATPTTYPSLDGYFNAIQKFSISNTTDRNNATDAGISSFYKMGALYAKIEDTRDKDSLNNTGTGANDYFVLFQNAIKRDGDSTGTYQDNLHRYKLAEIRYDANMIVTNKGYLDISGVVRFENESRRIPNTDHKAKVSSYSKKTTNLLDIMLSIQIGNYYYYWINDTTHRWEYVNPAVANEYLDLGSNGDGGAFITRVPLEANKDEEYFTDHSIAKSFANIDINNNGYLVPLDELPDIYGDIKIGLWTFRDSDDMYSSDKAKYNEISTIFIKELDVAYINAPLAKGDVEYYNSDPDGDNSFIIEDNTFKDENIISTYINNSQIDIVNNKIACQHPPCNNMALVTNGTVNNKKRYIPASEIYVDGAPTIPEDYSTMARYTQYSSATLRFELLHHNTLDMDVQVKFKDSSSDLRYYIAGASIDYYENLTKYVLIQKK